MDKRHILEHDVHFVVGCTPWSLPLRLLGHVLGWWLGLLVWLLWLVLNPLTLGRFGRGMERWLAGWEYIQDFLCNPWLKDCCEDVTNRDDAPPPVRSDVAPPPAVMPWAREE